MASACRSGVPPGTPCQDLEIAAVVWSDRSEPCATRVGHVEQRRPRRPSVRHPTQGIAGHASGAAFDSGA